MPAYLISDVTVRDPTAFETYRTRAAASIHAFGGRYLVRGGDLSVLEGQHYPSALVVVEFRRCDGEAVVCFIRVRRRA